MNVLKADLAAEQATAENDKADLKKQKAEAEAEQKRVAEEQKRAAEERAAAEAKSQANEKAAQEAAAAEVSTNTPAKTTTPSNDSADTSSEEATSGSSNSGSTGNTNPGGGNGVDHSSSGNMYSYGQCTWYVKNRAPWAGTYWGNGAQWGGSAAADGYTVNSTPAAGTIVVFGAGQQIGDWTADGTYGHVAYVESYNASNNTITISQGGMGFSTPGG